MAEYTTNYNLEKQQGNEYVDIGSINNNFDIVDTELGKLNSEKVRAEDGKGLSSNDYTDEEKTKLAGIADGANNYTHPSSHPPAIIVQDASNRFVTDTEKSTWNNKAAASHTHTKSQISDFPSSLPASGGSADYATNANYANSSNYANSAGSAPANGGNSDTVDGYHIVTQTTIPSSLSSGVICLVYE